MSALAPTLQAFFTDRLIRQRQASSHTLASYRDTMRLLVRFAADRQRVEPVKLEIGDLDASLISGFLDHRQHECGNSVRTRNTRLTAIRSLFRYAVLCHPEHAAVIQRVLAIPPKRYERRLVSFLTDTEVEALLAAPNRSTWTGRRDHALFATAVQTGLRISELIGLRCGDVHLGAGPHVSCLGKGRKQRITPLTASVVAVLRTWLSERGGQVTDIVFTTRTGRTLSRDALERRLAAHVATACNVCPTLREKNITVHVLRHTSAMRLLHAGVDTSVIARRAPRVSGGTVNMPTWSSRAPPFKKARAIRVGIFRPSAFCAQCRHRHWAHVTRNVLSALDLATTPAATRFCREALALDRRLFRLWHRFRGDPNVRGSPLTRAELIANVLLKCCVGSSVTRETGAGKIRGGRRSWLTLEVRGRYRLRQSAIQCSSRAPTPIAASGLRDPDLPFKHRAGTRVLRREWFRETLGDDVADASAR